MNGFEGFKKEVLKKIKKFQYQIKQLTQLNDDLMKKNKTVNDWLCDSRTRNAKVLAENFALKKIIAGYKRKVREGDFCEIEEAEIEMPNFLDQTNIINIRKSKVKP
jgi:hypothetical protein